MLYLDSSRILYDDYTIKPIKKQLDFADFLYLKFLNVIHADFITVPKQPDNVYLP